MITFPPPQPVRARLVVPSFWTHLAALVLLLSGSLLIKTSIWQQPPQVFNDSPGYLVPAVSLLAGRGYGIQQDGFRTPTLPLFLALVLVPFSRQHLSECTDAHRPVCIGQAAQNPDGALNLEVIVAAQIAVGIGTALLLYVLGWSLTHNVLVAFFFGAGYALNIATAYWEISILSETLTTFLVVLATLLFLRVLRGRTRARFGLGAVLAALALCHQLFLAFAIVPVVLLWLAWRRAGALRAVVKLKPVLVLPLLAVLIWSLYNLLVNGFFTPSTLSGYVLIQMVAPVMENAPEGYDGITQTYVGYRDAMIQETGSYAGAIHRAWRDMMRETDLSWSQISSKLTTLSFYLIVHYPGTYWQSVSIAWERFWEFVFFHYDVIPKGAAELASAFADQGVQGFLNILFWLCLPLLVVCNSVRRQIQAPLDSDELYLMLFMILTVWYAAIVSSLTNLGDNYRLRALVLPLQYGSIIAVGWCWVQTIRRAFRRRYAIKGY